MHIFPDVILSKKKSIFFLLWWRRSKLRSKSVLLSAFCAFLFFSVSCTSSPAEHSTSLLQSFVVHKVEKTSFWRNISRFTTIRMSSDMYQTNLSAGKRSLLWISCMCIFLWVIQLCGNVLFIDLSKSCQESLLCGDRDWPFRTWVNVKGLSVMVEFSIIMGVNALSESWVPTHSARLLASKTACSPQLHTCSTSLPASGVDVGLWHC